MSAQISGAIERIYRRVRLAIGRGRQTAPANDGGAVQMLQIRLSADEVRDNTPRLAEYGFTSHPPVGADAIVIFIGGDRSNGAVIATGHQASRLKSLQPGEVAIYDNLGQSVWLTRNGIVIDGNGLPLTINNTPTITMNAATQITFNTPLAYFSGKIHAAKNIESDADIIDQASSAAPKSMANMRITYNGHTHTDPQGGAVSSPNQSM